MGFQKGKPKTGGRLPGQPNKVTLEIKEYARAVIEDPAYQEKLKTRLLDGSAPQLEILMHYYAYGKPKQEITRDNTMTVIVQRERPPLTVLDAPPRLVEETEHER